MKILYGIQGTGHGHISRAREILPILSEKAEIDVLLSGYNCTMNLEDITVIQKRGISLTYDSEGSVSYLKTAFNLKPVTFIRDIHALDVKQYDLVISDFEPVTAWAAHQKSVFSIALSHQASFLSTEAPRPSKKSLVGEQILRHFAPCRKPVGFHFKRYDSFILPPIIRRDVRSLITKKSNHVTVYLPAFDPQFLAKKFSQIPEVEWHVFSPDCKESYAEKNVLIRPVGNLPFLDSMKSSFGVITGAGFETCAEAMFLGKKLLTIPISNQYEQYCNAAALQKMRVHTARNIDDAFVELAKDWIKNTNPIQLEEIADTSKLVDMLIQLAKNHEGHFSSEHLLEVQDANAYETVAEITA
ncbi:glycosyltransferase family protein [Rhodohalobacter sp. 614A]|uniref:glycosyltransferase family protein n=1 Tax=Rhodohalobacter sp. 614A TaxID=2908649 RepID=UPI001F397F3C|nr:glycosyltransferase family protein [Rhodohalobacter sp. 614A]